MQSYWLHHALVGQNNLHQHAGMSGEVGKPSAWKSKDGGFESREEYGGKKREIDGKESEKRKGVSWVMDLHKLG